MKMKNTMRVSWSLLLGATLLLSGGCGYKNNPVPPENVVPQAIGDLLYKVDEQGVKLTWSYPVKTIKGVVVEDISSFDLYRAEIPLEDYCGSCPIPFGKPIELDGGASLDGELRRTGSYESSMLKSGHKYFFKVQSRTSWLAASSDSNIVSFVWFQPAAAPKGLTARAGDRQVDLSWQPVNSLADGGPLKEKVVYQVMRSAGGKDFTKVGEPVSGTKFSDKQVINGQKYFYTVQPMMVYQGELVDGVVSKDVTVQPLDQTAPLPPTNVTAVGTDVGTKVFWDKSTDPDLSGYHVYRRAADNDTYQLLGRVEPEYTLFVDKSGDDSVRYYYAVTAVDGANPPNESNKSREATVRY